MIDNHCLEFRINQISEYELRVINGCMRTLEEPNLAEKEAYKLSNTRRCEMINCKQYKTFGNNGYCVVR